MFNMWITAVFILQIGAMMSQDIFIEVGHGPTLIDNNVLLSKASMRLATEGVAAVHNLCLGAITSLGSGTDFTVDGVNQPRYTPYHFRHRTEVAGFMTILHGDDRMYNNIFIQNWPVREVEAKEDMGMIMVDNQECGTAIFDEYKTYEEWISQVDFDHPANMMALTSFHFAKLPVWINGNAYFNGAKAWKKEQHNLVDTENQAYVNVIEHEDGSVRIETNVYDLLGDFKDGIINTEILGKAFEPEEYFEEPDGTPITFDSDYLGEHRGAATIPGPFATPADASKNLW